MTLDEKHIEYALAAGRAQHAGARARESGLPADWKQYAAALEQMARALANLYEKKVDTGA